MKPSVIVVLSAVLAAAVIAQSPQVSPVNLSQWVPPQAVTFLMYPGTTGYICRALGMQQSTSTITVSAWSNASPTVATATAHGFGDYATLSTQVPNPVIYITGASGSWAALNGAPVATVLSADTFSVPFDATSAGTAPTTIIVTTQAPRWNRPVWNVVKQVSDASGNTLASWNANGIATQLNKCSDRATLSYQ